WGLSAVQAGMLASTALAGMMFGAMIFGSLADKIGRKKVIMICIVLFSGLTFAGGFASNPTEFGILRFLSGLGIGGVMPNLVCLLQSSRIRCFSLSWRSGYWWCHAESGGIDFGICATKNAQYLGNHHV